MLKWKGRAFADRCFCCVEPFAATDIFAAGAGATNAPKVVAQAKPHRIDVHCHIAPPSWLAAMEVIGRKDPPLSRWSVQGLLENMDEGGVATSITSLTTPQVTPLGREAAARIARESNEFAKKMESDHTGRFGTFATLPLPNIDDSLKEIAYVFDTLKVDGVGVMTSYRNKWLGDDHFAPVWEELNRRKAVVYTHPTTPDCCANLLPGISDVAIEFPTDTARAIVSLIFSGSSLKYKDINWIWSHGGGSLTALAQRFQVQFVGAPRHSGKLTPDMLESELKRFFYDTAQFSGSITLDALSKLVPITQIVYGTDFPYRTAADHTSGVTSFFKDDDLKKVDRENALRLLPRFREA